MATLDADPWNWSVDDVQQFFQQRASQYISDLPHSRLPPLAPFLQTLRDSDVTGAVLLTAVDAGFLREDCGLKSLGIRTAVLHCINKLKQASRLQLPRDDPEVWHTPKSSSAQLATLSQAVSTAGEDGRGSGENVRSGEAAVEDEHGRKRRRLNPILQQPIKPVQEPQAGHLSDAKQPIDELFFGSTPLGGEVVRSAPDGVLYAIPKRNGAVNANMKPIGEVDTDDTAWENPQRNFYFFEQNKPAGLTHYVYRQMKHFLSEPETTALHRNGRETVVVLPYRNGLQASNKPRSAAVLQVMVNGEPPARHKDGDGDDDEESSDVMVLRENAALIHGNFDYGEYNEESATGEWDFLVQKYKHSNSDEIDLAETVDTEDIFTPSLLAEIAEEVADMEKEKEGRVVVTKERAEYVVDEAIEQYCEEWAQQELPRFEKTARTVWRKMKQSKTIRENLISQAMAAIEHMQRTLQNYRDKILTATYASETELKEACRILDGTVENIEEQKWNISVWRRTKEPPRDGKPRLATAQRPAQQSNHFATHKQGFVPDEDDRIIFEPASPMPLTEVNEDISAESGTEAGLDTDVNMDLLNDASDEMSPTANLPNDFIVPDEDSEYEPSRSSRLTSTAKQSTPEVKEEPVNQQTPQKRTPINTEPIDLVSSSDPDIPKPMKLSQPSPQSASQSSKRTLFPTNLNHSSSAEIDSWTYAEILRAGNVHCLLAKMLRDQGQQFVEEIRGYQLSMQAKMIEGLLAALRHLRKGTEYVDEQGPKKARFMLRLMKLGVAWWVRKPAIMNSVTASDVSWQPDDDNHMTGMFYHQLHRLLRLPKLFQGPKRSPSHGKKSTAITLSSDSDMDPAITSDEDSAPVPKGRRRRKPVKESQDGVMVRESAHKRMQVYTQKVQESQTSDLARLASTVGERTDMSELAINPAKDDTEDFIYLPTYIASQMKQHQIDGARFLWREITAQSFDSTQGCLLAHTMGLGKTMQTIAVLVAVGQAAESKETYQQLPPGLHPKAVRNKSRLLRIMVLCPASLLQNWRKEIDMWAQGRLGDVFVVDNSKGCIQQLKEWKRFGGMLVLGYPLFQRLISVKKTRPRDEQRELDELLLETPEVVVADEAHHLKNDRSATALAASRFATNSRIGLTGTPMSNDVQEIYALISWVAPGYLGDKKEFNALYTQPIEAGIYQDSLDSEYRKALRRLHVLRKQIEPKVNRADITALRGSLKSKVEFVITVPLTLQQEAVYTKCVAALKGTGEADGETEVVSNTKMFAWLGILQLLTNHPLCFKRKLLEPPPAKASKQTLPIREPSPYASENGARTPVSAGSREDELDEESVPGEEHVFSLGFSEAMVNSLVSDIGDELNCNLSAKSSLFLGILLQARNTNDKVLVFSSRIPALQYLEDLVKSQKFPYGRVDGSVPVQRRHELIEKFHRNTWGVLLISTKAGGLGLNIQGANRVIIFDFGFNPTWEQQAVGRAYRLGQQKPVFVYRFVAGGTFEANIYNKTIHKSSLAQRVVDKKNPMRHARKDVKDYLYNPRRVAQESITEYVGKDPDVLDVFIKGQEAGRDAMMRAIKTMEILQEEDKVSTLTPQEHAEAEREFQETQLRIAAGRATGLPPTQPARNSVATPPVPPVPPFATGPILPDLGRKRASRPVHAASGAPFASLYQTSASPLSLTVKLPVPSTMPAANPYAGLPSPSTPVFPDDPPHQPPHP